jgi:hypothetical protein
MSNKKETSIERGEEEKKKDWKVIALIIIGSLIMILVVFSLLYVPETTQKDCYNQLMNSTGNLGDIWKQNFSGWKYCRVYFGECECLMNAGNWTVTITNHTTNLGELIGGAIK